MNINETKCFVKQIYLLRKKRKTYYHSKRVAILCKKFTDNIHSVNGELVEKAALLHDIGKTENIKGKHNRKERVRTVLNKWNYDDEMINDIIKIISYHRGKNFKPNSFPIECSILRICDKLDKFEKEKLEIIEICEKNMNKIRKLLAEHPNDLNKFEETYIDLLKKILLNYPKLNL